MVQACCRGEEFSIDVFCDLDSRCLNAVPRTMIESKGGESIKGMTIADAELIEVGRSRLRDARARRAGEHPVLPRAGRDASRHRHQPALRRRLPAADRRGQPLSRARARPRRRRAAGAAARRFPRRPLHDPLFLRARAVGRGRTVRWSRSRKSCQSRSSSPRGRTAVRRAGRRMRRNATQREPPARRRAVPTLRRGARRRSTARAARASSSRSSTATATLRVDGARRPASGDSSARTDASGVAEIVVPRQAGPECDRRRARLRHAHGVRGLLGVAQGDDARLPAGAAVADVRRDAATRAQAQTHIRLRPPFRIVWSARPRHADRVPRRRRRRCRVHRQCARDDPRDLDAHRQGAVASRHAEREDGVVARRRRVGARLSHDGRPRVVLDRATGRQRWDTSFGSPIESSPIVQRRHRLLRRLERPALRARPRARTACAGRVPSARRSPRAPRSTAAASSSATTRAASGRSRRAPARRAGSRSVNGRIYGTPAVLDGRVFVPSSTGGSLTAFSTRGRYLWRVNTGVVRLLVAGRLGRPRLLRLLQRRLLRRLGRERAHPLGGRHRRPDLRAPQSSSTASRTRAASRTASSASTRAAAASCSGSGTDTTFRSPETGCAYFSMGTLVSMQWSRNVP